MTNAWYMHTLDTNFQLICQPRISEPPIIFPNQLRVLNLSSDMRLPRPNQDINRILMKCNQLNVFMATNFKSDDHEWKIPKSVEWLILNNLKLKIDISACDNLLALSLNDIDSSQIIWPQIRKINGHSKIWIQERYIFKNK